MTSEPCNVARLVALSGAPGLWSGVLASAAIQGRVKIAVADVGELRTSYIPGAMFGTGGSSWSFGPGTGGFSSSSSSSSSSGGGGTSTSSISQSQPGGQVTLQCCVPPYSHVVWCRQDGDRRRELARDGRLTAGDPRYRLDVGRGFHVMTIQPTRTSDTGVFFCESTEPGGRVSTHRYVLSIG